MSRLGSIRRLAPITLLAAIFAFAPIFTISAQEDGPSPYEAPESLEDLSGAITSDGSSTVGPLTAFAAEEFSDIAPNVNIDLSISGTGAGFQNFCTGQSDLQNASRYISDSELELCAENGIDFYFFQVASDGITVAVSAENDFVDCLSSDLLADIMAPDSEFTNWNQVNEDFPDVEMSFYTAADTSGTYDFFTEALELEDGHRGIADNDPNVTSGEDDFALVEGIAGDEGAIGYFGYSYYAENTDRLKALAITETGDLAGCVDPSPETITDGSYFFNRPLYVFVRADSLADNEGLQEFLRFYIANGAEIAEGAEFVAADGSVYAEYQDRLEAAITGEATPDSQTDATPEA